MTINGTYGWFSGTNMHAKGGLFSTKRFRHILILVKVGVEAEGRIVAAKKKLK